MTPTPQKTLCIRLPAMTEEILNKLVEITGYNRTQLICRAIEQFDKRVKRIKRDKGIK